MATVALTVVKFTAGAEETLQWAASTGNRNQMIFQIIIFSFMGLRASAQLEAAVELSKLSRHWTESPQQEVESMSTVEESGHSCRSQQSVPLL